MRVSLLTAVALLGAVRTVAAAPDDLQRAEAFYQRGMEAEAQSDESFRRWIATIKVGNLDAAVNRWVFALDQYSNAARLDPAHWRAHKRLGRLYVQGWGTHANDTLALLHLVAYLSLKPDDPDALELKDAADARLIRFIQRQAGEAMAMRGGVAAALGDEEAADAFRAFIGAFAEIGALPGGFATAALGDPADFKSTERVAVAQHAALSGLWSSRADTAGAELPGAVQTLETSVLRSASYVSNYLMLIGTMHRFMRYLDSHRVAYDPRLPEALIGQSIIQLRQLFTGRPFGSGRRQVQEEYSRYAALGDIRAADLWTSRDLTKPLPDAFIAAGTMEEPDRNQAVYETLIAASVLSLPGYNPDAEEGENENRLAAADTVASEAWKEWVNWRDLHLAACAEAYGLTSAEEVYVRDYIRVGSGEIAGWVMGPLAPVDSVSELPGERRWLLASAE